MSRDRVELLLREALRAIDKESSSPLRERVAEAVIQVSIRLGPAELASLSERERVVWSCIRDRIGRLPPEGGAGSVDTSLREMSDDQVAAVVEELRELHRLVASNDS